MKSPQFSKSKLSPSSEYALILGAGASAAVSLATQQVAAASIPVTALVAIGLMNRRRLDLRLQETDAPKGSVTTPAPSPAAPTPVSAAPVPEAIAPSHESSSRGWWGTALQRRQRDLTAERQARQQTSLKQIGAYLRQIRQEQALSLRDIHERTFIQTYMLNAIETGDLSSLPEPFYVRAFIQKYAAVLGLESATIAAQFPVAVA